MSEIKNFSDYSNPYDTTPDYSLLFGSGGGSSSSSGNILGDYVSIQNGSYKKLLKAYYSQKDSEKNSSSSSASKDTPQRLSLMKGVADDLKVASDALQKKSLWEKKKTKDGTEDYDWDAITKVVNTFVSAYNSVVEQAGKSDTKDILRDAVWMTNGTKKSGALLAKVGINVKGDNKLEVDADELKKADINALKTLFTGHNSFANRVSQKAGSMSKASGNTNSTYTKSGNYSNVLADLVAGKVNEEV